MVCWSGWRERGALRRLDPEEEDLVRYVIVIAAFAFFLIWDLLYNESEYLARGVGVLYHAAHWLGV